MQQTNKYKLTYTLSGKGTKETSTKFFPTREEAEQHLTRLFRYSEIGIFVSNESIERITDEN